MSQLRQRVGVEPSDAVMGLQIFSIFGTYNTDKRVISLLAALEAALKLGIVETTGASKAFQFAHDLITQVRELV
jgi:hypothetical protein